MKNFFKLRNIIKFGLSLFAVYILFLIVFWPHVSGGTPRHTEEKSQTISPQMTVTAPLFQTVDRNGNQYYLKGTSGKQIQKEVFVFDKPDMVIVNASQEQTKIISTTGVFDQAKKEVLLEGDIQLNSFKGYKVQTTQAIVNLNNKDIIGKNKVNGTINNGTIQADSFTIKNNGNQVYLKGNVQLEYDVQKSK